MVVQGEAGLRVLVVDDRPEAATTMAAMLASWGHEVRVAADGSAALAAGAEFRPHAVLLELGVPRHDGREVARLLREQAGTIGLLLVALTEDGGRRHRLLADESGFDSVLVTPAEPEALRRALAGG